MYFYGDKLYVRPNIDRYCYNVMMTTMTSSVCRALQKPLVLPPIAARVVLKERTYVGRLRLLFAYGRLFVGFNCFVRFVFKGTIER